MPDYTRSCREQYEIDFKNKAKEGLPYFWQYTIGTEQKKVKFEALTDVLFDSAKVANEKFISFCEFIRDRLAYTGQVLSLETLLNNKYDNDLRRITIDCFNNTFVEGLDIYNNDETDPTPLILFRNNETNSIPITLFNNDEVIDENSLFNVSFRVNVPIDVTTSDVLIRAILNLYVIAPQNYIITRF